MTAIRGRPAIFNLGHGIVPQTPPEHVAKLVERVRAIAPQGVDLAVDTAGHGVLPALIEALDIVSANAGNQIVADALVGAQEGVREGKSLSAVLADLIKARLTALVLMTTPPFTLLVVMVMLKLLASELPAVSVSVPALMIVGPVNVFAPMSEIFWKASPT